MDIDIDKGLLKDLLEKIRTASCYQAMIISGFLFSGGGAFFASKDYYCGSLYYDFFMIFGIVLSSFGFGLWLYCNQKHIDHMLELMALKTELEIFKKMSKKDIHLQMLQKKDVASKMSEEENTPEETDETSVSENKKATRENSLTEKNILDFVYKNITNYKSFGYDIQKLVKLKTDKGDIYFDIVAESRSGSRAFIIEIRNKKPIGVDYNRLYNMLYLYRECRRRKANVIIVYPIDGNKPVKANGPDFYMKEIGIPMEAIENDDQSKLLIDFK